MMVSNLPSLSEAAEKIKPEYVVIDFSMLASTGISAISEIKKFLPELKIIVISFSDEPAIIEDVMSAGALAYVLKQYVSSDLFDAIESAEKGKTFISPKITNKHRSN